MLCYVVYVNGAKVVDMNDDGYLLSNDGLPHMFTFRELVLFLSHYGETFASDNDKIEIVTVH